MSSLRSMFNRRELESTTEWRILSRVLGSVFIVSSVLKAADFPRGEVLASSPLGSPGIVLLTIQLEALLGLWLLSPINPSGRWVSSVATMVIMAFMNVYLIIEHQTSCGCFGGRIRVDPKVTLAVDLFFLVLLFLCRPGRASSHADSDAKGRTTRAVRRGLSYTLTSGILLAIGLGLPSVLGYPTVDLLSQLRGESLVVEPRLSWLGEVPVGTRRDFEIEIRNLSRHPVRIVGGSSDCSCVATESLPVEVPSRGLKRLTLSTNSKGATGRLRRSYVLFTDEPGQPRIVARMVVDFVKSPS